MHYNNDYQWGKIQENLIYDLIKEFFKEKLNETLEQTKKQYNDFDYSSENYNFELKSRKNLYRTFQTTMITANKVKGNKKIIFIFNYTDSIYYIEYEKEKFDKYQTISFSRANLESDEKDTFLIPIQDLTLIKIK